MQIFNVRTVRSKIVCLVLVAIIGFISLAAVNYSFNTHKATAISLVQNCQTVIHLIQKESQVVLKYLYSSKSFSEQEFKVTRDKTAGLFDTIEKTTSDNETLTTLNSVKDGEKSLNESFEAIRKNIASLGVIQQNLTLETNNISALLQKTKSAISEEEFELLMMGGNISPNKLTFKSLLKDIIPVTNSRLINFQYLFLNHDQELFTTNQDNSLKALDTLSGNFEAVLASIKDEKYKSIWSEAKESFAIILELENKALKQWKENKLLESNLDKNSTLAQELAQHIADLSNNKANSLKRTSQNITIIMIISIIVVFIMASLMIARQIFLPLKEVVGFSAEIAAGDLSQELPCQTNDELGRMAKSLNLALSQLSGTMKTTIAISKKLSDSAFNQASSLEETSASLEEINAMTKENFKIVNKQMCLWEKQILVWSVRLIP